MPQPKSLAEFLGTARPDLGEPTPPSADLESLTIADFCKGVLTSPEYRQSVLNRITLGTLPPAVEIRMYDYAYGKPPDRVEHTGKDGKPLEIVRRIVRAHDTYDEDADSGEKAPTVN
jgi:hypothetical protein